VKLIKLQTSPKFGEVFSFYAISLSKHHQEDEDYPPPGGFFLVMTASNEKRTPLKNERIFYGKNFWDELSDHRV
jgi:hypothetical protein